MSCRSVEWRSEDGTLAVGEERGLLHRSMVMKLSPNAFRPDKLVCRAEAKIEAGCWCLAKALFAADEKMPIAAALAGEIVERDQNAGWSIE